MCLVGDSTGVRMYVVGVYGGGGGEGRAKRDMFSIVIICIMEIVFQQVCLLIINLNAFDVIFKLINLL